MGTMAESFKLLLENSKLTNSLIEICQEFCYGVKDVLADDYIDHRQVSDQLTELRGVLEELLNAATTDDSQSLDLSAVNGQLARCRDELRKMEAPLKQGSGMKRIKGPTSSNSPTVLNDLAPITADLRKLMAIRRPEAGFNSGSLVAYTAYTNSHIDSRYSTTQNIAGNLIFNSTISDNDDRQRIRDWLSAPDPSPNHHAAVTKRGPGTGLWLIDGDLLQDWKFSAHSFTWFHGLPGCGKSVLCSTITQDIITYCKDKPGFAVAYFYFDFTDTQERQSSSLVRSFLTQLSFQLAECPEVLVKLHDRCQKGSQQASPADLMNTLKSVIECFNRHVYLMIDALDECSDQTDLLTVLAEISGWKLYNLHVLATSRREPDIEKRLTPIVSSIISLDSDLVDTDIRLYISTTLVRDSRFRIWTAAERNEISCNKRVECRFRLVTCQLDELEKCSDLIRLRKTLKSLPRTLEDTYEQIVSRIDDSEDARGDAVKLLQWLAFSVRPLTLAEMTEVFAINRDDIIPRFDPDGRPRDSRGILRTCPSLITVSYGVPGERDYSHPLFHVPASVRNTGTISLAHMSVKDYLMSKRIKDSSLSFFHLDKKLADDVISRECLAYLMQFDTVNCLEILSEATRSFGRYAAEFWIVHARSDDGIIHDDIQPLLARLLSTESAHFQNWIALFDMDRYRYRDEQEARGHPLYYASLLGLEKIVDQLASSSGPAVVNLVAGYYGSALASALAEGHEEAAQILLANGADVNLEGGRYGSALGSASAGGCKEIVQILLEKGVNVDVMGGTSGSALRIASANGREEIVQILLGHGANVDLVGGYHCSALASASAEGKKEIVQILLNSGADVNLIGDEYGTALASASARGHTEIVRILLDNGADVNLEGGNFETALGLASAWGCLDVVEILLKWGAEVNKVGKTRDSPLAYAAGILGNIEIVKILLEQGAEMDFVGGEYGSALAAASTFGRPEIAQFLLENGAKVNIAGGYYGSALASASAVGYKEIVQMLLEHGADVDLIGGECGTALASASFHKNYSNEEIVQMLLEHGAKVNLVEGKRGSALAIASGDGCKEIVEILLKNGADVNQAAGGLWGSALASASAEGRKEIVEILLDKGADVNFKNENGGSALYYAAQRSHEAIVQLLLDHGADPDDMIVVADLDDTPMDTVE